MYFPFLLFRDENLLPPVYDSFTWTHRFLLHPSPPLPSGTIFFSISLLSSPIFGPNGNPYEGEKCYVSPVVYTVLVWVTGSKFCERRKDHHSFEPEDFRQEEREREIFWKREREMPVNSIHEGETTRSLSWSLFFPFQSEWEREREEPPSRSMKPCSCSFSSRSLWKQVSESVPWKRSQSALHCVCWYISTKSLVCWYTSTENLVCCFQPLFAAHSLVLHPLLTRSLVYRIFVQDFSFYEHTPCPGSKNGNHFPRIEPLIG